MLKMQVYHRNKAEIMGVRLRNAETKNIEQQESLEAIKRKLDEFELRMNAWRNYALGFTAATVAICGVTFMRFSSDESARYAFFKWLLPTGEQVSELAEALDVDSGLASHTDRQNFISNFFDWNEAEYGVLRAIEKYAAAANRDQQINAEERTNLNLYRQAFGEQLIEYLTNEHKDELISAFTRPKADNREELIELILAAGKRPFNAQIEGLGVESGRYSCRGSINHRTSQVELALRRDLYNSFAKGETLQFLRCDENLPHIWLKVGIGEQLTAKVELMGVVPLEDKRNPQGIAYTVRATNNVMKQLGLDPSSEQSSPAFFTIAEARFSG